MTQTQTQKETNFLDLLIKFANKRPGLEFCDYGDIAIYRKESREITADLHDFNEFLNFALRRLSHKELNEKIGNYLQSSSDRLTYKNNGLSYITGQYFPTEYRPAATRVLRSILWNDIREEKREDGSYIYETGDQIRKIFKIHINRRSYKNYIN
jgi:hypothetical protein